MDAIKKYFGIICLFIGAALAIYLPYRAILKLGYNAVTSEDYIFWIIIITIFIPIIAGFILFGYYAFKGEYSEQKG